MGGVPDEISEEQIVEHFGRWGNVVDVYFPGKKGAKRVRRVCEKPASSICPVTQWLHHVYPYHGSTLRPQCCQFF